MSTPVEPQPSATESPETLSPVEPTVEDLLQQALTEKAEYWDRLLRQQAELENYRKRVQKERDEDRKYAALPVIRDLLPALDNLGRAVEACRGAEANNGSLLQGVEMVLVQAVEILSRYGAKPIAAVGQPFDPNVHEALQQVPSADHPPMTVLAEYERGFLLHDRVVRPSKVIVSVAPSPQT